MRAQGPNEADLEVTSCRLAEIESNWHIVTRPSKLFQEANYNENGELIFLHGHEDGKHAFKYGEHAEDDIPPPHDPHEQ